VTLRSDDDQAAVDRVAAAVPSVIDALVAELPEAKRAALEARCGESNTSWVESEGDAGALVLAAACRREIVDLPRHSSFDAWRLSQRIRLAVRRFENRPLGPWVWTELLGAIPSHKRSLAEAVYSFGAAFRDNHHPAVRAAIRRKVSTRGLLFDRLRGEGVLTPQELVDALADPPLRTAAEAELAPRVREVETRLRALLDDATPGTREAIVRLLRTIDERIDAAGETPETNLAGLEIRLRAAPEDVVTAQVWADLMQDHGDPRGALLALDLAIAQTEDRARKLELSAERAALFARERKHVVGKPGGFPFREKYLGRGYLAFSSLWSSAMRGSAARRFERVAAFLDRVTDAPEPVVDEHDGKDDDATFLDRRLVPNNVLEASFRLTWPNTRCRLPYQEAEHYPTEALTSTVRMNLASGKLALGLLLPFESFVDPGFVEVYAAIEETLGKLVLPATGFSKVTPTADGKKMKSKLHRYPR
jgi:hypothetical protein